MTAAPGTGLEAAVELRLGDLHLRAELTVPPGETVAVLGPNGAGKSTLLRALAGLEPVTTGHVVLDGRVLEAVNTATFVPPEGRPIGVVFQDYLLFGHLSVLENVAFGPRSRGAGRAEAHRLARDWLERVGLADQAAAKPAQLSGGQVQRVALARALVTEPRLLLLDEPLAALDASTRLVTRRSLVRALEGYAGVRLLVTHDPLEAAALADRLVVLEGGRIVQTGTLAQLRQHPRSTYVADLVGVNLLRGKAKAGRVELGGGAVLVAAGRPDGEVFAVVHPRAVALHRQRPEGTPRNVWPGVIEAVEVEGERARVVVGGPVPLVAEVTVAAVADLGLSERGRVWASVKASEVTVFPV